VNLCRTFLWDCL